MRPTYETEDDLIAERAIANKLEGNWKCKLVKLAKYSPVDYAATRDGKVVALIEVRVKSYSWHEVSKFGDLIIDTAKIIAFRNLHNATGVPVLLVIALKDCIIYTANFYKTETTLRTRNDAGSEIDTVLISKIPIDNFNRINIEPNFGNKIAVDRRK